MKSLLLLGIALVVPACQSSQFHAYHDLRTCEAEFEIEQQLRQAEMDAIEATLELELEAERKFMALRASEELERLCYHAVDDLLRQHFNGDRRINRMLITTVVDINNFNATTMFGRQFAKLISSRITQSSIEVIAATVREDHLLIQQQRGQFLLSRDVEDLGGDYNAKTALVSTYAVAGETVHVSLKLVSTVDNTTLAATDFVIYQNEVVRDMLSR